MIGEPFGEVERRGAADIMGEIVVHLAFEVRIDLGPRVSVVQFQDQRHQGFGDEPAAEQAEMTSLVRSVAEGIGLDDAHAWLAIRLLLPATAARAARTKARILSGSLSPGA